MRRPSSTAPSSLWLLIVITTVAVLPLVPGYWLFFESPFNLIMGRSRTRNGVAKTFEQGPSALFRYAYVFYVTNDAYGCGALVNMARLKEARGGLPQNVDLVMVAKDGAVDNSILESAEREMGAIAYPASSFGQEVGMTAPVGGRANDYTDCFLKFLAFLLPADVYRRLVLIDADSLILRPPHHLFHLPDELPLAAPSAYWLRPHWVSVTNWLMSVRPSRKLYETLRTRLHKLQAEGRMDVYDMDLFNMVFGKHITVLPPIYGMLDSELVENDHVHLGSLDAIMNGTDVWAIHFSGGGKPMVDQIDPGGKPGAHPGYTHILKLWTDTARRVCPPGSYPVPADVA